MKMKTVDKIYIILDRSLSTRLALEHTSGVLVELQKKFPAMYKIWLSSAGEIIILESENIVYTRRNLNLNKCFFAEMKDSRLNHTLTALAVFGEERTSLVVAKLVAAGQPKSKIVERLKMAAEKRTMEKNCGI